MLRIFCRKMEDNRKAALEKLAIFKLVILALLRELYLC